MRTAGAMRSLAALVALGWFWLLFYSVGPLTPSSTLVAGAAVLVVGCAASALWGYAAVRRRPPR